MQRQPRLIEAGEDGADALRALGMTRPRVMEQSRRMAGNYEVHVLTLAQVATLLRVEGSWPGQITLTAGWFRARARPWNDSVAEPMVRLERGGTEFLIAVREELFDMEPGDAYSPALYPTSTRVWRRAGFAEHAALAVMERPLSPVPDPGPHPVTVDVEPDWDVVVDIDRAAFEGFWGMSRLGLQEAHATNRATTLITVSTGNGPVGYAIVGTQWGVAYLHRIAVYPEHSGEGLGVSLLSGAMRWGAANGGRSMVLNVRADNRRARSLYERSGFHDTGTDLRVLRHNGN